jgi:heme exporter protein A
LSSNCPLWILDEPFTALDKTGVAYLENLCEEHLKTGGMIILTTHQPLISLDEYKKSINLADYVAEHA